MDGYGGLAIFTYKTVKVKPFNLALYSGGLMQMLSLKFVNANVWTTLILLYNPCKNVQTEEFSYYLDRVSNSGVVCGDLNAHDRCWDDSPRNQAGKSLQEAIGNNPQISMLNPKNFPTRIDPSTGKGSNLDIFLVTSDYLQYSLNLGEDLGSDHVPVILSHQSCKSPHLYFRPRWRIYDDKWNSWKENISNIEVPRSTVEETHRSLTEAIIKTSREIFKLTDNCRPVKPGKPWWNNDCEEAVEERRRLGKIFWRFPTQINKTLLNNASRKAKTTTDDAKRESWKVFLSKLDPQTPLGVVWKFFRSMNGYTIQSSFPFSNNLDMPLNDLQCAELLADYYSRNFSYIYQLPPDEKTYLDEALLEDNSLDINQRFTANELNSSIAELKTKSAPGKDNIHNLFLINLPKNHRQALLGIYNKSLRTGEIPSEWKETNIVPIQKIGKDPSKPESYRPISLLSCVAKLMEKMICKRLQWFLEVHDLLLPSQFGFRPCRATTDALTIFENDIKMDLKLQKVTLAVFIDLKAAFDRAAPTAILLKLAKMGVTGSILKWLFMYLKDRKFRVCVGNKSSNSYQVNTSVPQGSVLSPTLFNILMSDIPQLYDVRILIFADDITIYTSCTSMSTASVKIQQALQHLQSWCEEWGLQISTTKTSYSYYSMARSSITRPVLKIYNHTIPYEKVNKLLGLEFDSPYLTWRQHIQTLIRKCHKRLNIMKSLAGTRHGSSRQHLITYYQAYIKGMTDYGLPIYSSAAPTTLAKLNVIHSTAMRIITGAWRCTPLISLYCEVGIPPPDLQRQNSVAVHQAKMCTRSLGHPIHKTFRKHDNLTRMTLDGKKYKYPLLYRASLIRRELDIKIDLPEPTNASPIIPPWTNINPIVHNRPIESALLSDQNNKKIIFLDMVDRSFKTYNLIFTDGSLIKGEPTKVGAGLYDHTANLHYRWKLDEHHSILSAELFAILKAVTLVKQSGKKTAIFTDNMSALSLISNHNPKSYRHLVAAIQRNLINMTPENIQLHWVPSHCQIDGNEKADKEAKMAAQSDIPTTPLQTDISEYKTILKTRIYGKWQDEWNSKKHQQHLGLVKDRVGSWGQIQNSSRYYEVLFTQLRLGAGPLNKYLYKIKKVESPDCDHCEMQEEESTSHYMLHCEGFAPQRTTLKEDLAELDITSLNLRLLLGNRTETIKPVEKFIRSTERFQCNN